MLGKMAEVIKGPRTELSPHAPRFITIKIRPEKIREIIGPGGKVIRGMQEKTGAKIDVEDDGKVTVFSPSSEAAQMAIGMIQDICREAELDRIYVGKVKSIKEFGAFVEIIPGNEGLLHISQIAENRIRTVGDVLSEGDIVAVKVIEIDGNGKMRLSRKAALQGPARGGRAGEAQDRPEREPRLVAYRKSALPNGIRLVTETMPHVRSVAVGIWVETGSRLEPEPLGGISHLIEHLVFKGTATRSAEEIARAIDSVGGQMDAFTAKEHTCFYVQVLDEHLPLAVSLLTDILRAAALRPRGYREGEGGRPPGDQDGGGHPRRPHPRPVRGAGVGRPPAGAADPGALGRGQGVRSGHRARLLRARVRARADRGGGGRPRRARAGGRSLRGGLRGLGAARRPRTPSCRPRCTPASTPCRSRSSRCTWSSGCPASPTPRPTATRSTCSTTSSAAACPRGSSRRSGSGRPSSTRCTRASRPTATPALFYVYAGTDPANFSKVLHALMKEIRGLKKDGVTADELRRAKDHLKGSLMLSLESTSSRMNRLASHEMRFGSFMSMDEMLAAIDRVQMDEVEALIHRVLDEEQLSLLTLGAVDRRHLPRGLMRA